MAEDQAAWPRAIYSTGQVRGFDRRAIDEFGIDSFELMLRAGAAALEFLRREWPAARSLLIYCGAGNNAGDGYVLAALATQQGLGARVVAVVDPGSLAGDAARAVTLAREAGVDIVDFSPAAGSDAADLVVDALLGTGLTREVGGELARAVETVNRSRAPVLALDVPTGLDSDKGVIRGVAVRAAATVTFVGLKAGLYLGSGPDCRGRLGFSDLGVPVEVYGSERAVLARLDAADRRQLLEPRSRTAHKGLNGQILVVGGAESMGGAARLAAEAALRAGAGLVHAAVARGSVATVTAGRPEIMCRAVESPEQVAELARAMDVIVVGPGLGRDDWGRALARAIFGVETPLVVDADALNELAELRQRRRQWVLTPHPGEAGRLLGRSTAAVQAARDEAATTLAREFGAVAVLKGACSLVAEVVAGDEVALAVCDYGNPGMATGGTGDALAGVIGGLIAQFGFSRRAVETAVLVHALAGDDAAVGGERGMIASDLIAHIRHRVNPD